MLTIVLALSAAVTAITPVQAQRRCHAIDGDTLACGSERVRIMGLDTPEMCGQCPAEIRAARAAKDRLTVLIAGGISLEPHGRDRYRRLPAIVRDRQGRDVAQALILERHARSYDGRGRREGWCE
jgi:endonuclease YncB( thermonuclease family)